MAPDDNPARRRVARRLAFTALVLTTGAHLAVAATPRDEPPASADEWLLFQDIPSVYGASRFEQSASEAPASVTVITADEIAAFGWRTVAEALRAVRGFFTTFDRNYTYVAVRGFGRPGDYNTRVLLLLDGHRINDNVFDSGLYATESPVDISLVDRIEVIRGPSSSLYGTSAFFAVINVITKRGRDLAGAEIEATGASYRTAGARLSYGARLDSGLELLVSGTAPRSRGQDHYYREFDDPTTNDGIAESADEDERDNLFAKLSRGRMTFEAAYNSRTKQIPTASFGTDFNDPRARTTDRLYSLKLGYDRTFDDASRLEVALAYDDYYYDGRYPYGGVVYQDYARGAWWTLDTQHSRSINEDHKLVAGAFLQYNAQQDQGAFDQDPYFLYFQDEHTSNYWALYFQDEFRLGARWLVSAGVRHDNHASFGGTTNPRAGLIYDVEGRQTWKFLYGRAFRAPNAYERFYGDGVTLKTNPDLGPETVQTYEVVYDRALGRRFRASTSAYLFKIEDLISQTVDPADGLLVFENLDRAEGTGIELELDGTVARGITGRFSYCIQEAEDEATGETLTNSPRHLAKLNLAAPLLDNRLKLGLETQYLSERRTLDGATAGGYALTNLTLLAQDVVGGLGLSLSVYNLLDREYDDPGAEEHIQDVIPQDGRNYRLGVRYAF
jgi:iron complex outermembrane receptor protein